MRSPQAVHPTQPLIVDGRGVLRFKRNRIVEVLLASGQLDMNALAAMEFSDEDRVQFAQLIGYSLSGFSELPYVSASRDSLSMVWKDQRRCHADRPRNCAAFWLRLDLLPMHTTVDFRR